MAFEDAGFSDWDLLSCLTEADLDAITTHTGTVIAPGHRKKLLMASRQMGQSGAGMPISPLLGSARRYSHTSNPGNGHGSRAGGLAAAASAALDRRSGGRRPSGTASRVPSHHSHYGTSGHNSHPSHHYHPHHAAQSRNATDDGMISGRRARVPASGLLLQSRNSSRNSLFNGGGGNGGLAHAIGYIASPSGTLNDAVGHGGGGGGADERSLRSGPSGGAGGHSTAHAMGVLGGDSIGDVWPALDGRPSPAEPISPHPAAPPPSVSPVPAAGGSPGQPPPRQRKRWSVSQQASRGALINGSGPYGYGGSVVGVGAGGGGAAAAAAAIRPASASSAGCWPEVDGGGGGRVPQPDFDGGSQASAGDVATPSRPVSRLSTPRTALAAAGPGTSPRPRGFADTAEAAQSQPYNLQAGVIVAAASAGLTPAGAPVTPAHGRRTGPGADSTLHNWANGGAPPSPLREPSSGGRFPVSGGGGGGGAADAHPHGLSPTPPGGAWALHPDTPTSTAVLPKDDNTGPGSGGGGAAATPTRGTSAGGGSAIPRFVRAIAGWAVPSGGTPAAAAAAIGSTAGPAGIAAGVNHRRRSGDHSQSPQQKRRSTLADIQTHMQQQDAAPPQQAAGRWPRSAGPGSGAARRRLEAGGAVGGVNGVGLALPGAADRSASPDVPVPRVAAADEPPSVAVASALRGGRGSSRQMLLTPDVGPRPGPWDQDSALCIRGRGYRAATPSIENSSSHAGSRAGTGPGDPDNVLPSSPAAAAAAAARGGGWPFVMPQLPQPGGRVSNNGTSGSRPVSGKPGAGGAGAGGGPDSQGSVAASGSTAPVAPSGSPFSRLSPLAEANGSRGDGCTSNASLLLETVASEGTSTATTRRAPPVHSSRPPGWRPSAEDMAVDPSAIAMAAAATAGYSIDDSTDADITPDELAATIGGAARPPRVQIVHAGNGTSPYLPYDWARGGGGGGGGGAAGGGGGMSLWPAMPLQPPTRSRPFTGSPGGSNAQITIDGGLAPGPGVNRVGVMELLHPESPGPSRSPHPSAVIRGEPPGISPTASGVGAGDDDAGSDGGGDSERASAGGGGKPVGDGTSAGPPRPTPGRQLDLEVLADQVSRIMSHLSHITDPSTSEDGALDAGDGVDGMSVHASAPAFGRRAQQGLAGGAAAAAATAAALVVAASADGLRGGAASPLGHQAGPGGRPRSGRLGGRMEAMDRKRQELQELHRDLVTRVAALAAHPHPETHAAPDRARAQSAGIRGAGNGPSRLSATGSTAGDGGAAEALAEVEARIRSKLAELAALTVGPDARGAARGSSNGSTAGAGDAPRKRSLDLFTADGDNTRSGSERSQRPRLQPGTPAGGADGGGRPMGAAAAGRGRERERRRAEEVALHEEVLAVLGARKRSALAGRRGSGSPRVSGSGSGTDVEMGHAAGGGGGGGGNDAPPAARSTLRPGSNLQPLREHGLAVSDGSATVTGLAAADGGGAVLAEKHESLRAELLAIESKIRARVRESGSAATTRRA
ncbi:hypothetical protein GPECTOR_17g882 [Gonium pectorale]|uniref:SAM domain-containing protein n=1 Tax=Gonium pectorale TaxID=33097 RepID=A0A150GKD0_GONPE|nr:hypothetical protein GPECTOR_17g882 [Gonium pectorale]|eukprot:KXZ50244.1 hypothetical protein GPECTOR_17g882 [Gonium pectorale]